MQTTLFLRFALFVGSLSAAIAYQEATTLHGDKHGDRLGSSVALSADGTVMASGSPVRVFQRTNATTEEWSAAHYIKDTESATSIALSDDGMILAVGSSKHHGGRGRVVLYEWNGDDYQTTRQEIDGDNHEDFFGCTVALSSDGGVLAVGARLSDGKGTNAGHVRVYKRNQQRDWVPLGSDIEGESAYDGSGFSLSISSDGSTVAVGAPANRNYQGYVRVYKWESNDWRPMGKTLRGESANNFFGWSVGLSAEGTVCAVGVPHHDGNGLESGETQVFRYVGQEWVLMGQAIPGVNEYEQSGQAVALSGNGKLLAISSLDHANTKSNQGHVRVFLWNGNEWVSAANDLAGKSSGDRFGLSVALSGDGSVLAAGARRTNGSNVGHVQIISTQSSPRESAQIILKAKALR